MILALILIAAAVFLAYLALTGRLSALMTRGAA